MWSGASPPLELEIAKREGRYEEEGWRVRKDGSLFWANVVITTMCDEAGTLLGFAKVTRDLTERKRAEEDRLRLAQAEEAIRLRDEFLAIASHELKTPLTALQLQLQSLQARLDSLEPGVTSKLDRAVHSTERLAGLIETLLDVSRLSTGQLTLKPERMELLATVKDVAERLREAASHGGLSGPGPGRSAHRGDVGSPPHRAGHQQPAGPTRSNTRREARWSSR